MIGDSILTVHLTHEPIPTEQDIETHPTKPLECFFPATLCQLFQDDVIDSGIAAAGMEDIRSTQSAETKINNQIISLCWDRPDAEQISPRELAKRLKDRMGTCKLASQRVIEDV